MRGIGNYIEDVQNTVIGRAAVRLGGNPNACRHARYSYRYVFYVYTLLLELEHFIGCGELCHAKFHSEAY